MLSKMKQKATDPIDALLYEARLAAKTLREPHIHHDERVLVTTIGAIWSAFTGGPTLGLLLAVDTWAARFVLGGLMTGVWGAGLLGCALLYVYLTEEDRPSR